MILYQKRDVLILTDVFEKFLNLCLRHYEIVPAFWINLECWIKIHWNRISPKNIYDNNICFDFFKLVLEDDFLEC